MCVRLPWQLRRSVDTYRYSTLLAASVTRKTVPHLIHDGVSRNRLDMRSDRLLRQVRCPLIFQPVYHILTVLRAID